MAEERPSMSWSRMSAASKVLLIGSVLLFIDLFLPWYKASVGGLSATASGWHGPLGVLVGILVIVIIVMEALILLDMPVNVGTPVMRNQIEAGIALAVLVLTILHFLLKPSSGFALVHVGWEIWAWIGLILGIVIGYGGWLRWQEAKVTTPPPATGGGYAS